MGSLKLILLDLFQTVYLLLKCSIIYFSSSNIVLCFAIESYVIRSVKLICRAQGKTQKNGLKSYCTRFAVVSNTCTIKFEKIVLQ